MPHWTPAQTNVYNNGTRDDARKQRALCHVLIIKAIKLIIHIVAEKVSWNSIQETSCTKPLKLNTSHRDQSSFRRT